MLDILIFKLYPSKMCYIMSSMPFYHNMDYKKGIGELSPFRILFHYIPNLSQKQPFLIC